MTWWWTHRSIPPLDGRIPLAGLREPVEVRFDAFAIPHVFARSDEDAWRTVGYLQARDRLWQMELYRRAASGRLSELLGEATIAVDQRFLTLGVRQAADAEWARTPPNIRTAFESYSAGVNQAMSVSRARLPLEHQLLGLRPEPWTPVDSLAISKLFAWRLGENHRAELLRYLLVQELGPRASALFPAIPDWAPAVFELPRTITTSPKSAGASPGAGPGMAVSGRECDEQRLGAARIANRVGTADSCQRSPSTNRDAGGVVGSARRVRHAERHRRHHTGHPIHRHRAQRAARVGADQRRNRRTGFFHRAAGCVTPAISGRGTNGCR